MVLAAVPRSRSRRRCSARSWSWRPCSSSTSGIVICLRASGLLVTDHTIPKLHKRQVVGVFAAMIVAFVFTGTVAVGLVAGNTDQPRANPSNQGCNGYIELCRAAAQPDRVAGEPQRDVVERVQLPRRRAHDHDPRAAERGRPVPHARRVLRLRRQRARAHEPRRRREPRAAPRRSAAKTPCTSSTASARSPAPPTRRARSRTSTSATTSASSARCRRADDLRGHRRLPRPQPHRRRDHRRRGLRPAEGPASRRSSTRGCGIACGDRARSSSGGPRCTTWSCRSRRSDTEKPRRLDRA